MYNIINFVQAQSHDYKSQKSIYNIITGKKSHQTFFDAASQNLLSLYHSLPNLKYQSFERFSNNESNSNEDYAIITHARYTYDSLINTFSAIQLLTQTVSNLNHQQNHFIPTSQHQFIQQRVKEVFAYIKTYNLYNDFKEELTQLFAKLYQQHGTTYLHYYLQGYEESMYTRQQVSLIENIPQHQLLELEYIELISLLNLIEDNKNFDLLSRLIILPPLLNKTQLTLNGLTNGHSIEEIQQQQNVKINTIEDHLLELFIKGYLHDYYLYFSEDDIKTFVPYYMAHKDERLRLFKEQFPKYSYFQIKLMIVGIERGELVAT
ncbi:helix-turn-helix domain-containing protein [Helicobacter pylori]